MKKKRFARWIALLLCLASALSLAACGDSGEPASVPSETAESAETAAVPDRGAPDRSELKYTEAIEAYRKSDWTGNWIWTEACSEDSYVAFRKTFTLDEAAPSATAFISAADKYVLWINGELTVLDGSLKRGPTPYVGANPVATDISFNLKALILSSGGLSDSFSMAHAKGSVISKGCVDTIAIYNTVGLCSVINR